MQIKDDSLTLTNSSTRILILCGDDTIGREKARDRFVSQISTKNDTSESLRIEKFDSSQESFDQFIERINTPLLFAVPRLFYINHAEQFNEKQVLLLKSYFSKQGISILNELDTSLLIEYTKKQRKSKKIVRIDTFLKSHMKGLKKNSAINYLEFFSPPEYKMVQWLEKIVPRLFQRKITRYNAERLLNLIGHDIEHVYSELLKLDIHLPPGKEIDKDTINAIIGASRTVSPFELASAIAARDIMRTEKLILQLFEENVYFPLCIAIIFKQFWNLFKIRSYCKANNINEQRISTLQYNQQIKVASEIGKASGILQESDPDKKAYPILILSGLLQYAQSFSYSQYKTIFLLLKKYDIGIKTGSIQPTKLSLQILCYKIVRLNACSETTDIKGDLCDIFVE